MMFTLKSIQVNKCILTPAGSTGNNFRNKYVNCYNSSDDDLNAFVGHIEEKHAWTQYGQIIGQASSKTAPDISLEFYMEPQDSKVHTVETAKERAQDKDLFCDSDGCHSGFTRLVPVSPMIWLGAVSNDSDKPYLKHILYPSDSFKPKTFLVFRCQFPSEAHEWLLRPRERNWPSDVTTGKIVMDGCKVIPLSHAASSTPDLEWAFSFERAEVTLAAEAVTNEQKECFYFAKVIIDHIFQSSKIEYSHLKQVFFYMCEELENVLWEKKPLVCVYLIIERLLSCCRSRFLPNYFIAKNNMVDHLGEDDFSDAIQKLEILQKHMFLLFYLTLDAHNQILDNNARMVDSVVENMQRYCVHRSVERSMEDCFIPLAVEGLASYVKESLYKEFLKQAMPVWKGLTDLANLHKLSSTLTMEELLFKVVKILPTKYFQWICAFLLDQVLGTYFLETVCGNCETISIFHFFGQSLASKLNLSSGDIVIPTVLTDLQLLPGLVVTLATILKEILNIDGIEYKNCLAYFIEHYSADIFDSLENPNTTEMTRTMCSTQIKLISNCFIIEETKSRISRSHEMKVSVNSIVDQAEECFRSGRREEGAILAEKAMTLLKSSDEMEQGNHRRDHCVNIIAKMLQECNKPKTYD